MFYLCIYTLRFVLTILFVTKDFSEARQLILYDLFLMDYIEVPWVHM